MLERMAEGPQSVTALTHNNLGVAGSGSKAQRVTVLDRYRGRFWEQSRNQTGGYSYHKREQRRGNLVAFGL